MVELPPTPQRPTSETHNAQTKTTNNRKTQGFALSTVSRERYDIDKSTNTAHEADAGTPPPAAIYFHTLLCAQAHKRPSNIIMSICASHIIRKAVKLYPQLALSDCRPSPPCLGAARQCKAERVQAGKSAS